MLLLVVLSMLVLFMLIGTAFLMTSSQSREAAKYAARINSYGNPATKLLDRALMEFLRDTENPASVARTHSLLRDLYGTDGFQGVAYQYKPGPPAADLATKGQTVRFAGATAVPAEQLGATQGQFVDIYFKSLTFGTATAGVSDNDPDTDENEALVTSPDLRHVLKIDRNVLGQPQIHTLPLTKGYYNGCLLTITSGPAAGQSARIVDYECVNPTLSAYTRLFRFRVMAFPRADGQPLQIDSARAPEIGDLAGATFIVNGRPFNGTGVGYNPLATTGAPRLAALQQMTDGANWVGAEIALTPNAAYLDFAKIVMRDLPLANPFDPGLLATNFLPINTPPPVLPSNPTAAQLAAYAVVASQWKYQSFTGPGDADESYDAADFQNMFLALLTVTPRSQGRVVHAGASGGPPIYLDPNDPATFANAAQFLRLDLEDVPLPSFHRPDLVNFWYHRLLMLISNNAPTDDHVRALFQPFQADGTPTAPLNAQQAALIVGIKRKIMMRPIREDHPNFDGSNQQSLPANLTGMTDLAVNGIISIPYWEAVGPWDVDNDNDGVPDSNWLDLGDPVLELEDGTRVKVLYAPLIIDLDSRLNVNAHGLADQINPANLALERDNVGNFVHVDNLAGTILPSPRYSTDLLAQGLGYGPAEISLRPLFPIPWDSTGAPVEGNRDESFVPVDSFAASMAGRVKLDGTAVSGKYGYLQVMTDQRRVTAGMNYDYTAPGWANPASPTGDTAAPDLAAQIKFFNYPWVFSQLSAFGTPPDLFGRYALGIDYAGQPVYEVLNDVNPATKLLPPAQQRANHLLVNSPYELDQSHSQRRDIWANSFTDPAAAFSQSLGQNDDAPFATSDLERVLRAWDADSGTLPSRLWDVVNDFDPLKLMEFDPYRVASITSAAFGVASPQPTDPEFLATAQQMAAVSRRLATTDSFGLPVPGGGVPNPTVLALGADGQPGRAGVDDDQPNDSIIDEPDELNAANSDDFRSLFGKDVAQATIFDLLRYRVWVQVRPQAMQEQNYADEAALSGASAANYTVFLKRVSDLADARLNGEPFTDVNGNGVFDTGDTFAAANDINGNGAYDPPIAQVLAPELIAGKQMDLNRPFGDGQDNNNNGVVDDPLEAGEPFLDINGNGKCDGSEPFIDLNGDSYTPPTDQLWANLTATGAIGEPIAFDYTNGQGDAVYKGGGATVRNLESQARQLYARHLYCLMLLLVDEKYIAPWDENDPQIMTWIEGERKKLTDAGMAAAEADFVVKRKLTCRTIAQWAVNCVDMRDADAIMTPFEYDENPWDGWGVLDAKGVNVPLDGDVATDENKGEMIDWINVAQAPNQNTKKLTVLTADLPVPLNQTRGVVWGAERPELLISETLALHDRRTEDLSSPNTGGHDDFSSSPKDRYEDYDLDQSLRPRGSLFVEVYNPWSPDGQYPADLYSKVDSTLPSSDPNQVTPSKGVELGRLSNLAVDSNGQLSANASSATIKRSPVWRLIVVEEDPVYRNREYDNQQDWLNPPGAHSSVKRDVNPLGPNVPQAYRAAATANYTKAAAAMKAWQPTKDQPLPPFRPTNPDFTETFDAGFKAIQPNSANSFDVRYPYIEREFYFTTDNSTTRDVYDNNFKLRIPDRSIKAPLPAPHQHPNWGPRWQTQKFIATATPTTTNDQPIAPILPGRYGVVGSAGTKYVDQSKPSAANNPLKDFFTTTIGRHTDGDKPNTIDDLHIPQKTRRIELRPDINPDVNQLLVANNGGYDPTNPPTSPFTPTTLRRKTANDIGRNNEIIDDSGTLKNINDADADGKPDSDYYQPCVAVPVEGMNVSEPPWGWSPREVEAAEEEARRKQAAQPSSSAAVSIFGYDPKLAKGEGRYFSTGDLLTQSYDVPFDTAPELVRTGTTANHRTIHLQRLANPQLPWNPPPGQIKDSAGVDMHRSNLPINPYLTVDTSSVDLTAFNGTSRAEGNYPDPPSGSGKTVQRQLGQFRPWVPTEGFNAPTVPNFRENMEKRGTQAWHFKSLERGAYSLLSATHLIKDYSNTTPMLATLTQRVLPAEEPVVGWIGDLNQTADPAYPKGIKAVRDGRSTTMMASDIPLAVRTSQGIPLSTANNPLDHVDMVLEHSLGFGNESAGKLYNGQTDAPTQGAVGAPRNYVLTDANNATNTIYSTYPWLAWGNRPFVSACELLNVPAASASQMLRQFTTIGVTTTSNPYDGTGVVGGNPATNATRLAGFLSPFGHLLATFQTADLPAQIATDATGAPILDADGNWQFVGAPHFYRILEYVQVPSRYVGTETMLNAETFNDVPGVADTIGTDIVGPADPRYYFQPPFNKVSRERDPGQVNLNTVTSRRIPGSWDGASANWDPSTSPDVEIPPRIWSEVFDGIMHRVSDGNLPGQLGHLGPAWRDVVMSRKGYVQFNADGTGPIEKLMPIDSKYFPDVFEFGLNPNFPTVFANPFRSSDAGDLVPLVQMMHYGVDASMLRRHHFNRGGGNTWGSAGKDDNKDGSTDDSREAGFSKDVPAFDPNTGGWLGISATTALSGIPLFSETFNAPYIDGERNPYFYYQPMTRLGNLVTNRSGVFAIWITVGYFEVEKAPDWNANENNVQARFNGDIGLYNRVYPDGYMLGREVGSETGDVKRPRGFYIVDRTEEVGFKPGEDLNVERMIRLRRRIE